jgi:CRP-like cAMP-binding protein
MRDPIEILQKSHLFSGFDESVIKLFVDKGTYRTYQQSEAIMVELTEGDEIYVIIEGEVSVQMALAKENAFEIIQLGPGDIFGEMSVIEQAPRSATVTAEKETTVMVWQGKDWRDVCDSNHDVGYQIITRIAKILCARIRAMNIRLLDEVHWGMM